MAWKFCKGKEISKQIADKITIDILSGAVLPEQRLPGIEDMSRITGASAKMVVDAYNELIRDGIITNKGMLIINSDLEPARKRRICIAKAACAALSGELDALHLSRAEQLKAFGEVIIEKNKLDMKAENKEEPNG